MSSEELKELVKTKLKITDLTKDTLIEDMIQEVSDYCNITDLPLQLESFIRKKVKGIMDYESQNGASSIFDIKSISEGDTSITYNIDENNSKEVIYGLSGRDKKVLQRYRRMRK